MTAVQGEVSRSTDVLRQRIHITGNVLSSVNSGTRRPRPREYRPWVAEEVNRVDSFGSLAKGWDSYSAEPPNDLSRLWARAAIYYLDSMEFPPDRIAPSVEGGIAITWNRDGRYANIELFNSGELLAARRGEDGNPVVWEVPSNGLEAGLREIREYLNA